MDEPTLKLLKVIGDNYIPIKDLSNRLECYYTCTRVLLETINYNTVSGQISGVEDNSGSYGIKTDTLVRRIDLLESDLNQYLNT